MNQKLGRSLPGLGPQPVDDCGPLHDGPLPDPVYRQQRLLLDRLHRHKTHAQGKSLSFVRPREFPSERISSIYLPAKYIVATIYL